MSISYEALLTLERCVSKRKARAQGPNSNNTSVTSDLSKGGTQKYQAFPEWLRWPLMGSSDHNRV